MRRRGIASAVLLCAVLASALGLAAWKGAALEESAALAASQPEPVEAIEVAVATDREHRASTTSIGTVLALRSITLRNELPGTVREVHLEAGSVAEAGAVLVALDVSVEEAELAALEARLKLAETLLGRMQRASESRGASEADVDRARAERDVALAEVARTRALIERKTIRAPFRSRVGISDVHPGQYLEGGTELSTLQGVDDAVHVDFSVSQSVAAGLRPGAVVDVVADDPAPRTATIVAVDAKVDAETRNAWVRARVDAGGTLAPGTAVRVRVPIGLVRSAVAIPVSALRKGPDGDHVFVIQADEAGNERARRRRVESGPVLGDVVLVESGLAAGETVAASGSFKLREGVRIAVVAADASHPVAGGH